MNQLDKCVFPNDNNVIVYLPEDNNKITRYSSYFPNRGGKEVLLRKIITYLINNNVIDKTKNFIDLGAWIGDNAIPWSKNIDGIVYAIDPSSENCNYIELLLKINSIANVKIIQKAISDKCETLSTNGDIRHCWFKKNKFGKIKVNSVTLDYLYEQNEIDNLEFIHLDVEGMERYVISGSEKIIKKFKPIICFEQHLNKDNYKALTEKIEKWGYVVYMINEVLEGCLPDCRNFIAFPLDRVENYSFLIENINADLNIQNSLIIQST